jgi:uncharacterized membrane protein (DUF106 family)
VVSVLDWLLTPTAPGATVAIILLSIGISLMTSLANRLLTNREQLNAWRKEISQWTTEFNEARRSNDKKLMAKVKRQQPRITQLQSKMMWQSMKVSLLFMVPFFLIWQLLIGFYGGNVVAYLPWFGGEWALPIFYWYLLCSFLFSTLFSRVFGLAWGATE